MPPIDDFAYGYPPSLSSLTRGEAVTPSDSVDLGRTSRALWVGGAGAVSLITSGGDTITLTGVPAGTLLWVRATRVRSTGTTATSMTALS